MMGVEKKTTETTTTTMGIEKKTTETETETTTTTTMGCVGPKNEKVYKINEDIYEGQLILRSPLSTLVDDVGLGFYTGLTVGGIYHFMKSSCLSLFNKQNQNQNQNFIVAGIRAARANSPRVAGIFALYALLATSFLIAGKHYRRRQGSYLGELGIIAAEGLPGALLFAPRGLAAASGATVGLGLFSFLCGIDDHKRVYGSFTVPNPNYNSLNYRYLAQKQQEQQRGGGLVPLPVVVDDDVRLFGVK